MTSRSLRSLVLLSSALVAATAGGACSGGSDGAGAPGDQDAAADSPFGEGGTLPDGAVVLPFQADPPEVYVAKVKNLLVGMAPTQDEIDAVKADATKLRGLITGWMTNQKALYDAKMLRFFELAFQQTQITASDLGDQVNKKNLTLNSAYRDLLMQNIQESFARTMVMLDDQGHPFSEGATTTQFAMTTAMRELYAFLDFYQANDAVNSITDRFTQSPYLYITSKSITPAESAAAGPNFMHWYNPNISKDAAACDDAAFNASSYQLHNIITGSFAGFKTMGGTSCGGYQGGDLSSAVITAADFTDWQLVNVRAPSGGEAVTPFWDVGGLRGAKELVLQVPRVGFFTTPAFFANWQTNDSNEMRVTMNQAFIVATGTQVDGYDTTTPAKTPGLDSAHAGSPQCIGCHQLLDPTRSILVSNYSWFYHNQDDKTLAGQASYFAFQGVQGDMSTLGDLGTKLGTHPLFAQAWVQKLCLYANSAPCDVTDPEFLRVLKVFEGAGLSWSALVGELFSSPLVTNAVATQTTANTVGETVAVSRRDHLCAALSIRLGIADVCGLQVTKASQAPKEMQPILPVVPGIPSDGYGRGSTTPNLPNLPSLFYRAAVEDVCEGVAQLVVDAKNPVKGSKQWSSASPDAAIAEFVTLVMGIEPKDARYAQLVSILTGVWNDSKTAGASATVALQSAFVTACTGPSAVTIGL